MLVVPLNLEWLDMSAEQAALEAVDAKLVRLEQLQESEYDQVVGLLSGGATVTDDDFRRYPQLRIVAEFGTGYDGIDVDAARELGVVVTNVAGYCTEEVADHTLALGLTLARRIEALRHQALEGNWSTVEVGPVRRFADSTWGVIGFGRIGQAVARRAQGFGFTVCAYDPELNEQQIAQHGARPLELEQLLGESDILSIHAARTGRDDGMLNRRRLSLMKPDTYLVNVARGAFVDEEALADALDAGELAGAALDVLADEPPDPSNRLLRHPRVLVTPHAAWYSERAESELRARGIANVVATLSGRSPADLVPELR